MTRKHGLYAEEETTMITRDLSNTRCFIDCDGCLADTLSNNGYNKALDRMFMGPLTAHHYCEDYQDFGDAYDIIPGAPWRMILNNLIEYHVGHRLADVAGIPYPINEETGERKTREGHPVKIALDPTYLDDLERCFEDECVQIFSEMDYSDFAIEPVIRFCKEYKAAGGSLVIHSGTNKRILETILDACGIRDLFDDYLCSNMLNADPSTLGKWGYKTELLSTLLEKYPTNGRRDFVVGDTKGDAFGSFEVGLPFMLTWRGYPADPSKLKADTEGETFISPHRWVDVRQSQIKSLSDEAIDRIVADMLDFAVDVGAGAVS